jgi:hypothetical protein
VRGRAALLALPAPAARSLRIARVPAVVVRSAIVFFLYFIASLLLIGRHAISDPNHVCACIGSGDPQIFIWSLKWWPYALVHGLNPLFPRLIWSPSGANLAATTTIPLPSILSWPVTALFGPLPAYSMLTILSPAFAATTMYFLCEHITGRRLASLAGGWLFGFSTYELAQMVGHAHLMLIALLPLGVLLVLLRLEGRLSRRWFLVLMAAVFLGQLLTGTEVLASACFFGALAFAAGWLAAPRDARPMIARVALETLGAGLIAAVISTPYLRQALGRDHPTQLPGGTKAGTDLASLIVPLPVTLIRYAGGVAAKLPFVAEQGSYFGVPLLVAFAAALWQRRRARGTVVLAVVAAVAFVLSLGALLTIARHPHPSVPLPWQIAAHISLVNVALPNRLILYVWFALALAVAMWLASPGRWVRVRWLLVLVGIVMILPDGNSFYFTRRVDNPALFSSDSYRSVVSRNSTVLVLPFGAGGYGMLWQAQTGFYFRMPEGYVSYAPPRAFTRDPVDKAMLATQEPGAPPLPPAALETFLRRHQVRTVIVDPLNAAGWPQSLAALGLQPKVFGGLLIYRPTSAP